MYLVTATQIVTQVNLQRQRHPVFLQDLEAFTQNRERWNQATSL
jgi:hypothetical protein